MSRMTVFLSSLAVVALAVGLAGCAGEQAPQTPPAADQPQATSGGAQGQGSIEEALAQLSPADRALAEKQKVCPVSGEPLGSMGKPFKVTVKGQDVFLCCQGCEAEIKAEPDKYLAKLKQ